MMDNPLRSDTDYELFIYSIVESFPLVERSTLTFVRQGATLARVAGELHFTGELAAGKTLFEKVWEAS
jgi:hypothetical protein